MDTQAIREELWDYFLKVADDRSEEYRKICYERMDAAWKPEMTAFERKELQYRTITDAFDPVLFRNLPFYSEMGMMAAHCDGAGSFRGHVHAGNWNYERNVQMFVDQDTELWEKFSAQRKNILYLICGPYCDTRQHFIFDAKPVFESGLEGIYLRASKALAETSDAEEQGFLHAVCEAMLCMKRVAEKFSEAAARRLEPLGETDSAEVQNLIRIRDSAAYTPWKAPRTFYEALNTLAFLRTASGSLEGAGVNTFGRPDVTLYPYYERDLREGRLTKSEAYDLITAFLLLWDCRYDHDMKMVGYADHELENTYVLGGCDAEGNPVWNDLTEMFFRATREEKIIFPKITARFSVDSPREYFDAADDDVIHGTSMILYQNDDASIPALVRAGRSLEDARDYLVSGCWSLLTNGNVMDDHGNYVNLLKAFEFSVHNRQAEMEECGLYFEPLDGARDFEEVYARTVENCRRLFRERNRMTLQGKPIWTKVDPLPLLSASMADCIGAKRDLTAGGCKYHGETYLCVGFPNVLDSLIAIRTLCFERKICTLDELLAAVRSDWKDAESLRQAAISCHCWGDGSEESGKLAARFNHDLYEALGELQTLWEGGRVNLGHLTYTEIRFWGEKTLATPDGRHSGDYFSQGLTPSRLHRIDSVTDVITSLKYIDASEIGANNVINIILPSTRMTLPVCEAFLRGAADSAMQCLQLNCTTKEELLDAQVHPENHKNLIVRVCGFSARFTSLSPEWQKEVLSRNFYD